MGRASKDPSTGARGPGLVLIDPGIGAKGLRPNLNGPRRSTRDPASMDPRHGHRGPSLGLDGLKSCYNDLKPGVKNPVLCIGVSSSTSMDPSASVKVLGMGIKVLSLVLMYPSSI